MLHAAFLDSDHWLAAFCLPRERGTAEGPALPQDALGLRLERRVGPGMEERIVVANHAMTPLRTELRLELEADFADQMEAGRKRRHEGRASTTWDGDRCRLEIRYRARRGERRFERAVRVHIQAPGAEIGVEGSTFIVPLQLAPGGEQQVSLAYGSQVDGDWRTPLPGGGRRATEREAWRRRRLAVESRPPLLGQVVERAIEDLYSLRDWDAPTDRRTSWHVHAGVPSFTGLFGRDVLTSAWQASMVGPEPARGALAAVARLQATDDDPWRDAEPGKLIHEARRGPLSELGIIPHGAYYGTQTTHAMFILALSEAWHWSGERRLLRTHRATCLRALDWAERYGDRDGDGFLEYERRSPEGLKNQGWKDSDEAIRYPDGRLVPNPIATVEEQAFHILALQRMAEIHVALEEDDEAEALLEAAGRLRRRWHEAYWMAREGFYAMALDGQKQQVRSIGSNPGHALGAGLVPEEVAGRVADRLLARDLFSGWGVRTLSSKHPAYNPFGYHLGSVWPVENATFALGFKRYGLDDHVTRLCSGLLAAADGSPARRLPEALSGLARDGSAPPIPYPNANSPQAWSASATIQLLQTLLGIYPFAPAATLTLVRPRLPEGVDELTVRRLRVGKASVSLRFHRRANGSAEHEVLEREGPLLVVEAPPPQGIEGVDPAERLKGWALEHMPGRLARALRIALGLE